MSAEAIGAVAADLISGAVLLPTVGARDPRGIVAAPTFRASDGRSHVPEGEALAAVLNVARRIATADGVDLVDAQGVYDSIAGEPFDLYGESTCVAPPFNAAVMGYTNRAGNVILLASQVAEADDQLTATWGEMAAEGTSGPWASQNPIDWQKVRWISKATLVLGGRSRNAGGPIPTMGPLADLWAAVYDDGALADVHWVDYTNRVACGPDGNPVAPHGDEAAEQSVRLIQDATTLWLAVLSFLNCRNVITAEPARSRHERRRLSRVLGDRPVKVLTVTGLSRRSGRRADGVPVDGDQPLTSVRGHFGHYGDCCPGRHEPNGLLFGRYEGRYWRPRRMQGSRAHGEVVKVYSPAPEATP